MNSKLLRSSVELHWEPELLASLSNYHEDICLLEKKKRLRS